MLLLMSLKKILLGSKKPNNAQLKLVILPTKEQIKFGSIIAGFLAGCLFSLTGSRLLKEVKDK